MTEFTGLDIEMEIKDSYIEVVSMLEGVLLSIFRGLQGQLCLPSSTRESSIWLDGRVLTGFTLIQSDVRRRSRQSELFTIRNPSSFPSPARKSA